MQESQARASCSNHGTLHNHEEWFVAYKELAVETTRELHASIYTSSKYGYGSDKKTHGKALKEARVGEFEVGWVPIPLGTSHANCQIGTTSEEYDQGEDLKAETGQHDILAQILVV